MSDKIKGLIIICGAVFLFSMITLSITLVGRKLKLESFGNVPFSENYSVIGLVVMLVTFFIVIPLIGLVYSIYHKIKKITRP